MKGPWLIMALAAQLEVAEGDPSFWRVDTRTPAHMLPAGVCADATNKRFEDGRAWPRQPINRQPWGITGSLIPAQANYQQLLKAPAWLAYAVTGLVVGDTYTLVLGNATVLSTTLTTFGDGSPNGPFVPAGTFVATQATYWLFGSAATIAGTGVTSYVARECNPCGYTRFNDPNGYDTTVLLTDDWRDQAGEDGGRGRCWKVQSGNVPLQVSMNGSDIYGVSRLIPCFSGLVLLRQDNERHYFPAANVANNVITLNCAPAWVNGDVVYFWFDPSTQSALVGGANPPAPDTQVYVKNLGNNQVSLYSDSALTQLYHFVSAIGRFYLERQALQPGYYGNGAPPLICQPDANGNILWDVGWTAVPVNLQVSAINSATSVWTVPNHRLVPGDPVMLSGMPGGDNPVNGTYYVWPLNGYQFQLYDTQVHAMLAASGNQTGLEAITNDPGGIVGTAYFVKAGASNLPMPPAREGFYSEDQRLVLVNGANNILISDPLDPLHYTPFQASLTANLGESDNVVAVTSIASSGTLIFLKQNSVLALYNFSGGPTNWLLQGVTREYGCTSPLAVRQWGANLMFESQRGLDRVEYTAFGIIVGVPKPVSYNLKKYTDLIDTANSLGAVLETWNNRLFWAVPQRGQVPGTIQNNMVLVLNFLNSDPSKDHYSWEGMWSGAALNVFGFARHIVYGQEQLTFADYNNQVNWFDNHGWLDLGLMPIADSLLTRMYSGGDKNRKKWLKALVTWDTNNPTMGVTAQSPGYNEQQELVAGLTYDRTQYLDGSGAVYNPATQQPPFGQEYREDYSLAGPGELIGGVPDVHQDITETFRMRVDDWGVQLLITNSTGSCRLVSVGVEGRRGPKAGTRTV